jgi:hypothetical protein
MLLLLLLLLLLFIDVAQVVVSHRAPVGSD